jgi:hypothetical protein
MRSTTDLSYCFGIYLEGLRKDTRKVRTAGLRGDTRTRDLQEAGVLATCSRRSVDKLSPRNFAGGPRAERRRQKYLTVFEIK